MGFFEPSNMTPFSFQFPLADFDLSRLPVDPALLRGDASMLASAVQEFYRDSFQKLGGSATVLVRDGVVSVAWQPESGDASAQLLQHAIDLLRQGNASSAEPILRALLAQDARNADALYNLGMMLSDQGRLTEAVETLQESLNFDPTHSEGWTALGVAQARLNAMPEAVKALERATELDPSNAHALRNLAAIHAKESPSRALPFMQEAARLLPQDQRSQYGLAQCLLQLDRVDEADPLLVKAISLDPLSEIAELARTDRSRIAQANLRSNAGGGTRPDAVFFCLDAMQKFHALEEAQTKSITFEVAMLGRDGFDINSPDKKYTLKSLPGHFSGLHLVSIMYVGMKSLAPTFDVGIDLSEEYAEAKRLFALE
jgi:tetratricopeptide (TPR) repeat protein